MEGQEAEHDDAGTMRKLLVVALILVLVLTALFFGSAILVPLGA